jgi:hypothetical protein
LVGYIPTLIVPLLVCLRLVAELVVRPRLELGDIIMRCPVSRDSVVGRLDNIEALDNKNVCA